MDAEIEPVPSESRRKEIKKWLRFADGFFFMGGGMTLAAVVMFAILGGSPIAIVFIVLGGLMLVSAVILYLWARNKLPPEDREAPFSQVAKPIRRSFRRLSTHRQRQRQRQQRGTEGTTVNPTSPGVLNTSSTWSDPDHIQFQQKPPSYHSAMAYPQFPPGHLNPATLTMTTPAMIDTLKEDRRYMDYQHQSNLPPPSGNPYI